MSKKNKEIMVGVRFTEQDREVIGKAADDEGLTVASFVRKIVLQYVDGRIVESKIQNAEGGLESRIQALEAATERLNQAVFGKK